MREGWKIWRLGDACILTMGQSPESSTYNEAGNGMPFFQGCADFGTIHPTITTFCSAPKKIAEVDDVLMSVRAPIGTLNVANVQCCIGRGLASIRQKPGITIYKYLYYFISKSKKRLQDLGTGATFKAIGKDTLVSFPIPVPPIAEQEKIVAELDCLTGIIEKKKQQLKELDNLAQSIFYDMFGDPITNERGWEVKKLKDVAEIVGGSTPKTNVEEYWNGQNPWVAPAELHQNHYISSTERGISNEAAKSLTLLPVGTVLLSSRAPIGKVSITTIPMYCNQGFKNVVCSKRLNNEYVYQLLLGKTDYLNSLGTGATFKEISKKTTENIAIAVPPIELQEAFAARSKAIETQKELVKQSIVETETLFNSRMDYWFN